MIVESEMKIVAIAALLASTLCATANAQDAAPAATTAVGTWAAKTMGGVEIEIAPCGDAMCGKFKKFYREKADAPMLDDNNEDPALRARPLVGVTFIEGMKGGPTEWTGGKLYYPNTGSFYDASLAVVSPDQMKIKVCLGSTCREQVWNRVS